MRKVFGITRSLIAVGAFWVLGICGQANAAPVQWRQADGGNDHYYEVIQPGHIIWLAARDAAEIASVHLATITSEAENIFVTDLLADTTHQSAWVGGYQVDGSIEPDGGWRWVTPDEAWSYWNWKLGEPNDSGGENALQGFASDHAFGPRLWNDLPNTSAQPAYVTETPEPATLSLLVLGGLAMVRRRGRGGRT